MKTSILLAFLFTYFSTFSQDCTTLNNLKSFHGLAFGQKLPDSIYNLGHFTNDGNGSFTLLDIDSLKKKFGRKYDAFFKFLEDYNYFNDLFLYLNSEKKFYGLKLGATVNTLDTHEDQNKYPGRFVSLYNQLVSVFGKESKTETQIKGDLQLTNFYWECEKTAIQLKIYNLVYLPNHKLFDLEMFDVKLKKEHLLDQIK